MFSLQNENNLFRIKMLLDRQKETREEIRVNPEHFNFRNAVHEEWWNK